MNDLTQLKIGRLAKLTGLTVGTLRYYSDLGLLKPVVRKDNGYRYYSQNAIKQVEFIKKSQAIGFSLEEIKMLLNVRDNGEKPCKLVRELLNNKIAELTIQIEKMSLFKEELERYRDRWMQQSDSKSNPQEICPLISSVSLKN